MMKDPMFSMEFDARPPRTREHMKTVAEAVRIAFQWSRAPEGESYWTGVYHYLIGHGSRLPKLPPEGGYYEED